MVEPSTAAAAPVVAGHRGAVLPGVPAGRRRGAARGAGAGRAGRRGPRAALDGRDGRARHPLLLARSRTTPAASTSAPTPTPWDCWSARRWPPPGRRGAPGTGRVVAARARPGGPSLRGGCHRRPRRARAGSGWWRRSCGSTSSATPCTAAGFLAFSLLAAVLVGAVADPAGLLGRALGRQPCAGSVSGPTASTCGTGRSSCSAAPGSTSTCPRGWRRPAAGRRARLAELSYRFVELPVRRGAVGRAVARVRRPHEDRARTVLRVVAAAVGVVVVGGVATAALAQVPRVGADAGVRGSPEPVPALTPGAEPDRTDTDPTPRRPRHPADASRADPATTAARAGRRRLQHRGLGHARRRRGPHRPGRRGRTPRSRGSSASCSTSSAPASRRGRSGTR